MGAHCGGRDGLETYISTDPHILHGAVCLRGARVPVSVVLDNLAANESPVRIMEQYPSLTPEHIRAATTYAADLARERIVPMPAWAPTAVPVRFKLDENIPVDAGQVLRESGHDVETVLEERLGGKPDPDVLRAASDENRTFVTLDLDFA